jgi:DNA-directed RNA polymerase specialized sigma24 family protein
MKTNTVRQEANQPDVFQRIVMHAFGLRPIFRKVFLLCDIRGCSIEETADILRISPTAVTARLMRARREMVIRLGTRH